MSDQSGNRGNAGGQRMVDAVLRVSGASSATVLLPSLISDNSDAGQLGITPVELQALSLAPVIFRRTRPAMQEGQPAKYEMLISASSIEAQVYTLELNSAFDFIQSIVGISISGLRFTIESWACSTALGRPVLYRLLLRDCNPLNTLNEN